MFIIQFNSIHVLPSFRFSDLLLKKKKLEAISFPYATPCSPNVLAKRIIKRFVLTKTTRENP